MRADTFARKYYDLAMIAADDATKTAAFADVGLLHSVVEFKDKFYPLSWANYGLAVPGTFRLLPTERNLRLLGTDYRDMQVIFFGEVPPFDEMVEALGKLEDEINNL